MRAARFPRFLLVLVLAAAASGCKSDGDTRWAAAIADKIAGGGNGSSAGNSPPQISGRPKTRIAVGRSFAFAPKASDPDGDTLSFSVANKPAWAQFDPGTGALQGRPGTGDVGRYENVTISASDGRTTNALPPFDVVVVADTGANEPPAIYGSPSLTAQVGSTYSFTPSAVDPENDPLTFRIENAPAWARFDASTGTLAGVPSDSDVGAYPNVVIVVSDGQAESMLDPFSISVSLAATRSSDGGAPFGFSEVPEISFVQSYAETENLGIFHLDTSNRWTPGDLENESGWSPRVPTQLDVLDGSLGGISYDAGTGILAYDGRGGAGWALVQLSAPTRGARSNPFYVRVLMPDAIWGKDATKRPDIAERFPSVPKFDYGETSYEDAWAAVPTGQSPHDGEVMLILDGAYSSAVEGRMTEQLDPDTGLVRNRVLWRTNGGRATPWLYILGEPGRQPKFSGYDVRMGGSLAVRGYLVSVVKNLEFETMLTDTANGGWQVGVPNRKYWSRLYVHSTHSLNRAEFPETGAINNDVFGSPSFEGDTEDKTVRMGVPIAPNDFKSFFWNNRFLRTGGNSLKHTIYLHGRPDAWLFYNNNRHNGGNASSAVKATLGHLRVLNSRISAFADESSPGDPEQRLNQQLIDVPSCSDSVIYNNQLVGGHRMVNGSHAGTRTGLIWFSPRRTLWGTDMPRYPDITYQAAPFEQFEFKFKESQVNGKDYPSAWLEIRQAGSDWQRADVPTSFAPNATGGGSDWLVQLGPNQFPVNGKYELRINGGARQTEYPIQFTVYRNPQYFAITSFYDSGRDHPWYADGPKAYVIDDGADYWTSMTNWGSGSSGGDGRSDPSNPYTIKKFISYNTFTWLTNDGLRPEREEAVRDHGTLPAMEFYSGSSGNMFGAVPPTWVDAAVTFLANNRYDGWQPEDVGTEDFLRNDVGPLTQNARNVLYGPGQDDPEKRNWPNFSTEMPVEKRPLFVPVGGEKNPVQPTAPDIALPAWFRFQ